MFSAHDLIEISQQFNKVSINSFDDSVTLNLILKYRIMFWG